MTTLVRDARLPRPDGVSGNVVGALAEAGFFRLRGVLVGTIAFQCYSALLGVRLPAPTLQTGDLDLAQFHSISVAVGDSIPPILDLLRGVDPTYREVPHHADGRQSTKFAARDGFKVEFLTPNTGSVDYDGRPTPMPALGRAAAEPLRFLDFLIYEPVRAILLHGAGIPVLVPQPARYAVHKLIVAARRSSHDSGAVKSRKDLQQAATLIEALLQTRASDELAEAYVQAFDRGPHWRDAIDASLVRLEPSLLASLHEGLARGLRRLEYEPAKYLAAFATGDAPP